MHYVHPGKIGHVPCGKSDTSPLPYKIGHVPPPLEKSNTTPLPLEISDTSPPGKMGHVPTRSRPLVETNVKCAAGEIF